MPIIQRHTWLCALALAGVACGPGSVAQDDGGESAESSSGDSNASFSDSGTRGTTADTTAMATDGSSDGTGLDSSDSTESDEPPPEPACRDGVLDPNEECDDGNAIDDDECNNDCVLTAAIVWDTSIPPGGEGACAHAVALSPTGQIGVGGLTRMGSEFVNAWVGILDEDGTLQWQDQWDGGQDARDEVVAVAFDGVGNLHFATSEENDPTSNDSNAWLYKRGADGSEQWAVALERPSDVSNYAADLVVGPDGGATLLATSYGPGSSSGLLLQRHAPDGSLAWPSAVSFAEDLLRINDSQLRQDATGELYVVGVRELVDSGRRAFLERYSLDGVMQWSVQSDPPVWLSGDRMVVGATRSDGYSTLALHDAFAPEDLVLRSWDASGDGPDAVLTELVAEVRLTDAAFDSGGNLIVTGNDSDGGWVVKVDPAGAVVWVRRGAERESNAVAVGVDDEVVVAGCVMGAGGDQHVWVRRYAG